MKTYTIQAFGMELTASERGAQITSWKDSSGREHIWSGNPAVWGNQAPTLFPVCGSTQNLTLDGQPYELPKHGFIKEAPWQLEKQETDTLVLRITDDENSHLMYPFSFQFSETLRLIPQGFSCTYTIENLDVKALPFCVGAHPGFTCPMEDSAIFSDYDVIFDRPEDGKICNLAEVGLLAGTYDTIPLANGRTLPLDYHWFDEKDTLLFEHLQSKAISLIHRKSGHGLRMDFSDFKALALWTMPGKQANYLCIEPWVGVPQTFGGSCRMEDKLYLQQLASGEAASYTYTVTLI